MGLIDRNKLEKPNTEISHYLGVVVDNKDPEFKGRAKVRIFGIFDDLGDTDLPWAHQRFEMSYGLGGGSGRISVPKLGSVVHVQFNNGNNSLADSLRIKTSPRMCGNGAPAGKSTGDMWVANGYFYMYANSQDIKAQDIGTVI